MNLVFHQTLNRKEVHEKRRKKHFRQSHFTIKKLFTAELFPRFLQNQFCRNFFGIVAKGGVFFSVVSDSTLTNY